MKLCALPNLPPQPGQSDDCDTWQKYPAAIGFGLSVLTIAAVAAVAECGIQDWSVNLHVPLDLPLRCLPRLAAALR